MKMQKRKLATDRRDEVLTVALQLATDVGYKQVTRKLISNRIGITEQAIQHHIGTMEKLRRDIMRAAIRTECLPVIAQGMASRDPHAMKADDALKAKARAAL